MESSDWEENMDENIVKAKSYLMESQNNDGRNLYVPYNSIDSNKPTLHLDIFGDFPEILQKVPFW